MTDLLMFEVDVKNVMEKEGRRRRGPARIWGSDYNKFDKHDCHSKNNLYWV